MQRSSEWVAKAVGGQLVGANLSVTSTVETDSRECSVGSIYVARQGESADGHDYAAQAVQAGAVCVIAERQLPLDVSQVIVSDSTVALGDLARAYLEELREIGDIKVAGITGSAGKTTTKDLLGRMLEARGETVYPVASFNNEVGCPLTILRATESTRFLVLEMGASGPGHLRYLTDIAPLDIAVELLVGQAHLGGFGSVEVLALSKQELVEGLLPGGIAVLNLDDPQVARMAGAAPGPVYGFSAKGKNAADLWAERVVITEQGRPRFELCTATQRVSVQMRLSGVHQVSNALAAVAAAVNLGMPLTDAARQLELFGAQSPHRMDVRRDVTWGENSSLTVIDDAYNANPDSMRSGLAAARQIAGGGRLVAVLGEMLELGDSSADLHRQVGQYALAAKPSAIVGVGSGARDLMPTGDAQVDVTYVADAQQALSVLPEILADGDTIFLKGSYGSGVWKVSDALMQGSQR